VLLWCRVAFGAAVAEPARAERDEPQERRPVFSGISAKLMSSMGYKEGKYCVLRSVLCSVLRSASCSLLCSALCSVLCSVLRNLCLPDVAVLPLAVHAMASNHLSRPLDSL